MTCSEQGKSLTEILWTDFIEERVQVCRDEEYIMLNFSVEKKDL